MKPLKNCPNCRHFMYRVIIDHTTGKEYRSLFCDKRDFPQVRMNSPSGEAYIQKGKSCFEAKLQPAVKS